MDICKHARVITPNLAGGLARLELRLAPDNDVGGLEQARLQAVLADGWQWVIARAREEAVALTGAARRTPARTYRTRHQGTGSRQDWSAVA